MDRIRAALSYIYSANHAYLLVLALVFKALVADVSYATFLITIPILSFEGYKLFLSSKKPDPVRINSEVRAELDQMKAKLSAVSLDKGIKQPVQRYF